MRGRGGAGESSTRASGLARHGRAQRSRARRRARRGRGRRARLPHGSRLDRRRIPRRRGVLRPQRLPDHAAPGRRALPHGRVDAWAFTKARARRLLPALVTCVVATLALFAWLAPDRRAAGRRAGLAALRPELAPRGGRAAVLGGVRAAVAAAAPVVAVGGGAAVPAVAAPAGRGAGDGPPVHGAARHGPAGVRLGAADGAALRPRRRLAGLLRDRRPGVRVPGRCGVGVGVAAVRVVGAAAARGPLGHRRRRDHGAGHARRRVRGGDRVRRRPLPPRAGSCGSGCSPRC